MRRGDERLVPVDMVGSPEIPRSDFLVTFPLQYSINATGDVAIVREHSRLNYHLSKVLDDDFPIVFVRPILDQFRWSHMGVFSFKNRAES